MARRCQRIGGHPDGIAGIGRFETYAVVMVVMFTVMMVVIYEMSVWPIPIAGPAGAVAVGIPGPL